MNCEWGEWSGEGSACSQTCDMGTKEYTRNKRVQEKNGGLCLGEPKKTEQCTIGIECFPGKLEE